MAHKGSFTLPDALLHQLVSIQQESLTFKIVTYIFSHTYINFQ